MNILITICGRGGSKGIPGKNIKLLNNKPLIAYTIETAQKLKQVWNAHIALSTDSDEIKKVAAAHGLPTSYSRPATLATDTTGKVETILDVLLFEEKISGKKYDYVVDMDVTSPLRTVADLEAALHTLTLDKEAYNLYSVNPANRNPYFNMVEEKDNHYFNIVKEGNFLSRQAAPKVYDMNSSFYLYRRSFFDLGINKTTTEKSLIYIMPHTCFDLDHPVDFDFMEYLVVNNKLDFEL